MELVIPPVQNTSHIESILFLISPVIIVSCSFIRKEQRSSAECYFTIFGVVDYLRPISLFIYVVVLDIRRYSIPE